LSLATGSGKTRIAVQLLYKLEKAGSSKSIRLENSVAPKFFVKKN